MTEETNGGPNGGRTFVTITNRDVWEEVKELRKEVRTYTEAVNDYAETKSRLRALELKFYVIGAGLLAAIGVVVMRGGLPT